MSPDHLSSEIDHGLRWRRSTRCTIGTCVEVALTPTTVFVRDSKQSDLPDQPIISVASDVWSCFVDKLGGQRSEITVDGLSVAPSDDGSITMIDNDHNTVLRFDDDEWSSFVAGAIDGEFS